MRSLSGRGWTSFSIRRRKRPLWRCRLSARAKTIIPYAYEEFGGDREPARNHEILFVAGFGHPPNVDAAVWLASDVMKLIWEKVPDATLALVGANPTPVVRSIASSRVEVRGRVSEDELRARYGRARIAIVPLRMGAGVKSKVVEALREGLPLVTTQVGAQGLPGIEACVAIADDASEFGRLCGQITPRRRPLAEGVA